MLNLKNISEVNGLRVYTIDGEFFGEIEDAIVSTNKVVGWRVRTTNSNSLLKKSLPSAKGVQIPHQLVRAIGQIMIIENATANITDTTTE